ncbi:MAG TPA: hypothetical protein V6C89_08970 [Drouetiella sp.]|jgi:hypothetical protein
MTEQTKVAEAVDALGNPITDQVHEKGACAEKSSCGSQDSASKKPYTKPTLRKFSQIDYVTAYGVD